MRALLLALATMLCLATALVAADRPNVLWVTSEDNGPQLGCYGDDYAVTPNLDAFAEKSCRYLHCWSNAPVCAPARTTIISGMYPTSLGAQHMRSQLPMPEGALMFPQYLRQAGYYCTNNSKEDYNLEKPGEVWDDSSRRAHWKNRQEGQPFFAIFNFTISHESQIRNRIDEADRIHDPAKARVPAYHPDTPEVRKDWAQYYDRLTMMDRQVGETLKELEEAGLAEDTIVFYYGDHGSGMPRSKRFPYNSGLHVPLIVHIPEKWKHLAPPDYDAGRTSDRLVSFVDLAPTLLHLCGVDVPQHMQGRTFLGKSPDDPPAYNFGFRGRMDERIDMMRSVTDGRYVYLCNYMPHRPYGQYVDYMFQTPTTRVWKERFEAGELTPEQSRFWQRKPVEELYDLQTDPDEVQNLADSPDHQQQLAEMRSALVAHLARVQDVGFLPEHRLNTSDGPASPYDRVRSHGLYRAAAMHELAVTCVSPDVSPAVLRSYITESRRFAPYADVALYWAATGALANGKDAFTQNRDLLRAVAANEMLEGDSGVARIVAAEALATHGNQEDVKFALPILLEHADVSRHGVFYAIPALNALDYLDEKAATVRDQIGMLPRRDPSVPGRLSSYVDRLISHITAE